MQLKNEFLVAAGAAQTWALLTDLERIAPCMPGASLGGREGADYLGNVKVKVGPISAHFHGTARFVEQDDAAYRATIQASGKDPKGQAHATALIQARLEPESATSTRVFVDTDLDITGRMAQFGRGAIADVSNRLIKQFTENLSNEIQRESGVPAQAGAAVPAAQAPAPASDLNLLAVIGPTVAKQAAPVLVGVLIGLLLGRSLGRGRRSR
jgi:carbon monoxide dehydrogenase subunit G